MSKINVNDSVKGTSLSKLELGMIVAILIGGLCLSYKFVTDFYFSGAELTFPIIEGGNCEDVMEKAGLGEFEVITKGNECVFTVNSFRTGFRCIVNFQISSRLAPYCDYYIKTKNGEVKLIDYNFSSIKKFRNF